MDYKPSLLITQSFIFSGPGTYWDYRDYIFCLCSNQSVKDSIIRLNVERGQEFAGDFRDAAKAHGFSNAVLTSEIPASWAGYMVNQINANPATWVMPWPGDHIYINPDEQAFIKALKKGEDLGADAVLYGHMQDFEYYLDWDRINVLYNDENYVMIEWGRKHRYRQNEKLQAAANQVTQRSFYMIPVPAFAVYRSGIFKEILEALPKNSKRWQDMENSPASASWSFKLLIPKQCLYRHVHGYWLEGFFKYYKNGTFPTDVKAEMESWYVRANYDWKNNSPTRQEYLQACLKMWPYFKRYLEPRKAGLYTNEFGSSPFDTGWKQKNDFQSGLLRVLKNNLIEPLKLLASFSIQSARKIGIK